jgi:FMN phosphatase YigB (HAD superfamily)
MIKKIICLLICLCVLHNSISSRSSTRDKTSRTHDKIARKARKQSKNTSKNNGLIGHALIWDLGNTLFRVSKMGMAQEIGFSDFALYKLWDHKDPIEIQKIAFKIMADLKKQTCTHAVPKNGELEIPALMCDWFIGDCTGNTICDQVNKKIEELDKKQFFFNEREKRLVTETLHVMLDPQKLAENMKPVKQAIRLLSECCALTDKMGKPLHKQFILSNWDPESFDYLYDSKHGKKVFNFFNPEHIVISGDIGLLKPNPAIYQYMIDVYKLDPKKCIVIDDQQENIDAARAIGMTALLLQDFDYKTLRNQLRELHVII